MPNTLLNALRTPRASVRALSWSMLTNTAHALKRASLASTSGMVLTNTSSSSGLPKRPPQTGAMSTYAKERRGDVGVERWRGGGGGG